MNNPTNIIFKSYDFVALSIQDLLDARDLYHLHLMNKRNVLATAIGYYRIRKKDKWPTSKDPHPKNEKTKKIPRTLGNSEVRPYSWPAILVFVSQWEEEVALIGKESSDVVPKTLFLPNGKAVPVCVIEAKEQDQSVDEVDITRLEFPRNVISGGFPLLTNVQNNTYVASFGCLVTDGHLTYALTNKHVTGNHNTPIYTMLNGRQTRIGQSSKLEIGRVPFEEVYPTLKGKYVYVNMDVGLVELDNLSQWKTEIYKIGKMDNLVDIHSDNLTLRLINRKVICFGAASGKVMEGEIQALFYRYKSTGGFEYVSDFLIGPTTDKLKPKQGDESKSFVVSHGDSGTIILLEVEKTDEEKKDPSNTSPEITYHPLGILWGQHDFPANGQSKTQPYALGTFLSTACSKLNVELIRDWNSDLTNTWGKTGHFKVGALACELVSNAKLRKLLMANQRNIGYTDSDLQSGTVVTGKFTHDFVPLADVADIIWRTTRPDDSSNHFADVDEIHPQVHNGKSLLQLSKSNDKNLDIDFWLAFDKQMDAVKPAKHPRRGALPFRVWQMYNQMIASLQAGNLKDFVVAGGTMSHYVGDACQPLHVSFLHHGRNDDEANVHSDYETTLIDKKMADLFVGVKQIQKKVKNADLIAADGKSAAKRVLQLMSDTINNLPPLEVVETVVNNTGHGRWDRIWNQLGQRTIENIAEGARVLSILWQSAWVHGEGDAQFKLKDMGAFNHPELQKRYNDKTFVQSFMLDDTANFKAACF